jgi:signal peptidase
MKDSLKNLIGWIIYIAILISLVYGIPRVLAYLLDTPYPMASITSESMWPALKKGDLVLIKGIKDKSEIKVGDIVVYHNPKGFTIHRVIKLNKDTLITKGDANNVSDPPVRYQEIIGKTLSFGKKLIRIPLLGNISILINKPKL